MIRRILLLFAFLASPAEAATIPFLDTTGAIDTKNWYISDNIVNGPDWNACTWMAGNAIPDGQDVELTVAPNPKNTCGCELPTPFVCGELQSKAVQSYGTYTARIKTASGKGLVTAFFTYVMYPQHDEIDFEFLGKFPTQVSLNWWVNGQSLGGKVVNLGFDASQAYHDYTFTWFPSGITWYVDGKKVYATPANAKLPTHAQKMYIDLWAAGPQEYGWAGHVTYTGPISAEYESVSFTPYDPNAPAPIPAPPAVTPPVQATTPAAAMRPVGTAR